MVGSPSPIQELRTRLEHSRWQLHDGLLRLETQLTNPPASVAAQVRTQPQAVPPISFVASTLLGMGAGMAVIEMARFLRPKGR